MIIGRLANKRGNLSIEMQGKIKQGMLRFPSNACKEILMSTQTQTHKEPSHWTLSSTQIGGVMVAQKNRLKQSSRKSEIKPIEATKLIKNHWLKKS